MLLLEAPNTLAFGDGEISTQQHEDFKCHWDDFKMQTDGLSFSFRIFQILGCISI